MSVINLTYCLHGDYSIPEIMEEYHLTEKQAEQVYGAVYEVPVHVRIDEYGKATIVKIGR